jgi:type I restriction enzyme S subunit
MIKKYKEYKLSKFKWFEHVPVNWHEGKISYFFEIGRGRVISELELNPDAPYPVYSSQTKNDGRLGFIDTYDFDDNILTWTTDGANAGTVFIRSGKFNCTNVCGTLKPKVDVDLKYYFYYLQTMTPFYKRPDTNGAKIMNNEMARIYCLIPPIQEQTKIAQYLDTQTATIDQLIQQKEKLIELLKEKRQAAINEAVTKGLNPNAKMKDSGVEWIGEIPEDWIKSKVKYVSTIFGRIGYRGYTVEDIVNEGEGVITISPSNIKNDIFTIEGENTFLSFEKYEESPEIQIFTDDIILVKTGSTIGKTSLIPSGVPKMTINPQLVVLKQLKINNKYFYYQTVCEFFKKSFLVEQTGSSTPTISQEKINGFPILIPSTEEQQQIVELLDLKTKEIDDLVQLEQKKIDLLKEYRQSLISEVVTGKIKVTTDE